MGKRHYSEVDTRPEDDWFTARCGCGWEEAPLPGLEEVMDSLMFHAYGMGWKDGKDESDASTTKEE